MPTQSAIRHTRAGRSLPAEDGVTSLEKGLAVLERLSAAPHGAGVTELARDLGLPKSTVARLLLVLGGRGYVWREPARPVYRLGPRALELTANTLDELLVVGQARPHLYDLAGRVGQVACLGVLWAATAVIVDVVEPPAASPAALAKEPVSVGRGAVAYASSIGKAILAFRSPTELDHFLETVPLAPRTARTVTDPQRFRAQLALVRDQGYAVNDGESTDHGWSLAAPVHSHTGEALAAIAVTRPRETRLDQPLDDLIHATTEAARRISFNLGYHPRAFR
ncbi:MAG TPA: IclR family transcriptional regulator [Chloroflexota bacterium]|nr:IclR family transcriptional regulator [Chloroflexota bacterium]